MNISQNKIAPNMQPAWKVGIQINNTVYTSKEKNYKFSSKNPFATKHSPTLMFIIWHFFAIVYLNIV